MKVYVLEHYLTDGYDTYPLECLVYKNKVVAEKSAILRKVRHMDTSGEEDERYVYKISEREVL